MTKGTPLEGDHGAFDVVGHPEKHATDIRDNIFSYHKDPDAVLEDHDHSGDVGSGGQFPVTNLESTGGTNGQFLVADGAGGLRWVTIAGGVTDHIHVTNEDLSSFCNGVLETFDTALVFLPSSTMVFLNGLLQQPGVDYDEDVGLESITLASAPLAGDVLLVSYQIQQSQGSGSGS